VQAAFGGWSNEGARPSTEQMPLPPAHTAHAFVGTAATQVFIQLGQPAVARTSSDYDAFSLLSEILGGPGYFESRLWQELRQKRGLVYSVQSRLKAGHDRGDLEIVLSASPQNVPAALALVREQLQWLRTHEVSAAELQDAKIRLVSEALLAEGSASGQLDEISEIARNGLPLDYYGTLVQRYRSITPADLQRTAKAYLRPDRLIEVFAGPEGPWSRRPL
jgi:zinc protease